MADSGEKSESDRVRHLARLRKARQRANASVSQQQDERIDNRVRNKRKRAEISLQTNFALSDNVWTMRKLRGLQSKGQLGCKMTETKHSNEVAVKHCSNANESMKYECVLIFLMPVTPCMVKTIKDSLLS